MLVLPNIYLLRNKVRGGNIYVIEEKKGLTLIDCGLEGSDEGILDFIESLGSSPEDLRMIILTHGHLDHVGALPELIDITDAQVLIHEKDLTLLRKFTYLSEDLPNLVLLRGGEMIDVLNGLQVIHSPGHTDGSIILYKENDLLFSGDVLVVDKYGNPRFPDPKYTKDQEKEKISVKKLSELNFNALLPGHGPPIIEKAYIRVKEFVRRHLLT